MKTVTAFIVEAGIGKTRSDLFKKQLKNLGAKTCDSFDHEKVTHVIVDEKMNHERLSRILKLDATSINDKIKIVKSVWLSSCIRNKTYVDTKNFELIINSVIEIKNSPKIETDSCVKNETTDVATNKLSNKSIKIHTKLKTPAETEDGSGESDYKPSSDEEFLDDLERSSDHLKSTENKVLPKGSWICAQSSSGVQTKSNCNEHITEKLEEMANTYQSMNDKWRAVGYQKAIIALKKHPKEITSFDEAKSLNGVGRRLAEKIWEIAESGELRKLNELTSSEENQSMVLFTNIWGVGAQTARAWMMQGFRTFDDLREKTNLTKNQEIGLKYYEELMDRMPREEAALIEAVVKDAALTIQSGLIVTACGSYRRGKSTCGDVDILITHPDGKSHLHIYKELLHKLHDDGFLTDDLVSIESEGIHKKYLGVCRLPGENTKHRRLDIIVIPYNEYACALVYFTGSAHFNRSLRHLAGRMNMSLNEHALCTGVIRSRGTKLNAGTPLHTPTEKSVFDHLGIPFRLPEERDH